MAGSYFCHNCGDYIGWIGEDGELLISLGSVVLEHGTFRCGYCGERKVWGKADYKLDKIVARQLQHRRRLTKEVVG